MKKTLLTIFAALAMSSSMAYATNNQNNSNNTTNYNTTTNQGGDALAMQDVDVKVGVNTNITNDVQTNASAFASANSDSKSTATGGTAVSGGNTQNTTITEALLLLVSVLRETARSFAGVGLQQDALAILCTSKYAAAAPSCKKD